MGLEPGAIVLFILAAIVLRALDTRRKQSQLPPVIRTGWPAVDPHPPAPHRAPVHPVPEPIAPRASHSHAMTATAANQPPQVHSPLAMTPTSPHVLVAPPGSALAQLQQNIEARRLSLEARMQRGGSPSAGGR